MDTIEKSDSIMDIEDLQVGMVMEAVDPGRYMQVRINPVFRQDTITCEFVLHGCAEPPHYYRLTIMRFDASKQTFDYRREIMHPDIGIEVREGRGVLTKILLNEINMGHLKIIYFA